MPTTTHLLLAVVLTLFLAAQAGSFVFVMRCRRAVRPGRGRQPATVLWASIPVVIVLALAARSWVAAIDIGRPAAASAITAPGPGAPPR